MNGIHTDYPVGALSILLDRGCLTERYWPLIPYRDALLERLTLLGCRTKNDAAALSNDALRGIGLPDAGTVLLLRRFFALYDPAPAKFREIEKVTDDPALRASFRELYHLPGVRAVRAELYCRAGYGTLRKVADAVPEEVITRTERVIRSGQMPCAVPLPKEVRTHIAVARAFLWDAAAETAP